MSIGQYDLQTIIDRGADRADRLTDDEATELIQSLMNDQRFFDLVTELRSDLRTA